MTTDTLDISKLEVGHVRRRTRRALLKRIEQEWPVGHQLPPLRELATELGTAYGTLRATIQSLVQAGVLVSLPRQGVFVARVPGEASGEPGAGGAAAQRAKVFANQQIELIHHASEDDFVLRMVEAFRRQVEREGATTSRHTLERAKSQGAAANPIDLRPFKSRLVALFNPGSASITWRDDQHVVIASTAADTLAQHLQGYDLVTVDQEHGARLAAEALRTSGVTRPCFLGVGRTNEDGTPAWDATSAARYESFRQAWPDHDTTVLVVQWYGLIAGARIAGDFMRLEPRPDGVFAATDELAVGFIAGVESMGLQIGRGCQIVGFDGQQRARDLDRGPLATVQVPVEQMGAQAAEMLQSRVLTPDMPFRRVQLGCSFLKGSTITGGTP